MALIFVTIVLSTALAFIITSSSKIIAALPSLLSLGQKLGGHITRADTFKNAWTTTSTFVEEHVGPEVVRAASVIRDEAGSVFNYIRASLEDDRVGGEGDATQGDRVASRVWNTVSTTSISYAQQAADALRPLNPSYGPQRLRADVWEDKENNTVTAEIEVPGIAKPDIDIAITNGQLIITTKRETPERGSVYFVQDRPHGEFELKMKLPVGTRGTDLNAGVSNGVLTISYPRVSTHSAIERIKLE